MKRLGYWTMEKVKCRRCEKIIDADKAIYKGIYIIL